MKKKLISLLCVASLLIGLLAGCGSSGSAQTANGAKPAADKSASGTIQVGIVLPTKDEPRWLQDQAQFESILSDAGFTNQVMFSQGSSATEKTNVETLISKGISVLIICAQDGAAAAAAVEAAKAAGVTVIAYDRLITGTDAVDYYVTFDSFAVGAAQGQYLVDNAPAGSGIPLYLYAGAATDNNSSEAEALQNKAELTRDEVGKIVGQVTTDWDFNVAKSKAEANLTAVGADKKGDVLVLAPNDGTARSIADVFAADKDVSSYVITGQDSEKASVQYVIDGKQSMTVFKDTRTLAADSVAMAMSILNGETPKTDTTYNNGVKDVPAKQTDIVVVTKSNVKEALIDSEYYDASDFTGL